MMWQGGVQVEMDMQGFQKRSRTWEGPEQQRQIRRVNITSLTTAEGFLWADAPHVTLTTSQGRALFSL